ncbi:unnamed protein product, partial [marine sediment metagenome]
GGSDGKEPGVTYKGTGWHAGPCSGKPKYR